MVLCLSYGSTAEEASNFGFVVFDDSEPVQKILSNRPIKFRGDVRLNVEEKKTRSAREGDRRDIRPRGPGGPGGPRERIGGPRGPPTRGGMAQKPSFGSGRVLDPVKEVATWDLVSECHSEVGRMSYHASYYY
uniref:ras GTPase-activating protein-binding protein 1-like n=1 Tax=Oncorhynchus gorbuscha TaxID=8017 RepID=UPI001EAF29C0|nr:ras GTPase-activating protein-binding protein 1-like [Oncorhynchus gorbuscha]